MHCHILQHEDNGAMGWANAALGGLPAPTLPPGKDILYACGGGGCNPVPEGPFGSASCTDGIDNDCDTLIDAADPDCQQATSCSTIIDRTSCRNTVSCEWQGNKNNGMCVDAPPPPNCSYGTRQECNNEPTDSCRWKNNTCIPK